jgi:hypothetical protein
MCGNEFALSLRPENLRWLAVGDEYGGGTEYWL